MTAIIIIAAVILLFVILLTSFVKIELEYDDGDFFVKLKYLCFTLFPKSERKLKREKKKEERKKKKQEKLRRKKTAGQHLNTKKRKAVAQKAAQAHGGTGSPTLEKTRSDTVSSDKTPSEKSIARSKDAKEGISGEKAADKKGSGKPSGNANPQKEKEKKEDKPKPDLETVISCVKAAKPYVKRIFKKIRIKDTFIEIIVGGENAAKTAVSYGIHCAAIHGLTGFLKNTLNFTYKKIDVRADFDLEKTDYYLYCKIRLRLSTLIYCALWGLLAVKKAMGGKGANTAAYKAKENRKKAA